MSGGEDLRGRGDLIPQAELPSVLDASEQTVIGLMHLVGDLGLALQAEGPIVEDGVLLGCAEPVRALDVANPNGSRYLTQIAGKKERPRNFGAARVDTSTGSCCYSA